MDIKKPIPQKIGIYRFLCVLLPSCWLSFRGWVESSDGSSSSEYFSSPIKGLIHKGIILKGAILFLKVWLHPYQSQKELPTDRDENSPLNRDLHSLKLENLCYSPPYNSFLCWKPDGENLYKFYVSQLLFLLQPVHCRILCPINAKRHHTLKMGRKSHQSFLRKIFSSETPVKDNDKL